MSEIYALFFICSMAVLAPLLVRLPPFARMPVVVLELILGIMSGPSGANWVAPQGTVEILGRLGLL